MVQPALLDSQVAWAESQPDCWASIWLASSSDSWAALVWFLLWEDLAQFDLVYPLREGLSIVACRVWNREDLSNYTGAVHIPGGCQE